MQPAVEKAIEKIGRLTSPDDVIEAIDRLDPGLGEHNFIEFLAGRAQVDRGLLREGIQRLKKSAELRHDFSWTYFELARAHHLNGELPEALLNLRQFLDDVQEPLGAAHTIVCEQIADAAAKAGRSADLTPLYARLERAGSTRYVTLLRALEASLQNSDVIGAKRLREAMGEARDAWGHLAFAWYAGLVKDALGVAAHLSAAHTLAPGNLQAALRIAHLLRYLADSHACELASGFVADWAQRFPPEDAETLKMSMGRAVLASQLMEIDLALALRSRYAGKWPVVDYLYVNKGSFADGKAAEALAALDERFSLDADVLECVINVHISNGNFDHARLLCERAIQAHPSGKFLFKNFEIECYANNMTQAEAMLGALQLDALDASQRLMIVRMRAEQGQWETACDLIEDLLLENLQAEYPADLIDLTVRSARRTQSQGRFVALLGKHPQTSASARRLLMALLEDLAVHPSGATACVAVLKRLRLDAPSMLAFKLRACGVEPNSRPGKRAQTRRAIFYCADRAYVLPAVVSMVSMLESNPSLHTADYYMVVDDAVAKAVAAILKRVGAHFQVNIQVTPASEITPTLSKLSSKYGIFTGGHQLAKSAYYRIYMAHRLAESKQYDELLYVDSDTLVRDGFDDIFSVARKSTTLLLARPEVDRPEIRKARARHEIGSGQYFNSGVLFFSSTKPGLVAKLKEAARIAEEEPQRLLFQDQCALNLAFKGEFEPLPEAYNFFVAPADAPNFGNVRHGESRLIHTLDRPKPWDSLYPPDTAVQRLWVNAVRKVTPIVGDASAQQMLAWTHL